MGPMKNETKKVLIVDDETSLLKLLGIALKKYGFEVITASDISEAMYLVKNSSFDLVLTDVRLGVAGSEDGLLLLGYIQEISPGTKVIIMTGSGTEKMEKEAYEMGADYYFEKPVDLKVLNNRLYEIGAQ